MRKLAPLIVLGAIGLLILILFLRNELNYRKINKALAEIEVEEETYAYPPRKSCVSVSISAYIEGLGNDTILVWYTKNDTIRVAKNTSADTTNEISYEYIYFQRQALLRLIADESKFHLNLDVVDESLIYIYPQKILTRAPRPNHRVHFPLALYFRKPTHEILLFPEHDKPQLTINGKIERIDDSYYLCYNVTPASLSADYADDRKRVKTHAINFDRLTAILAFNNRNNNLDTAQIILLQKEHDELAKMLHEHRLSYIRNNPNKDLSAHYLLELKRDSIFIAHLDLLSNSVKLGQYSIRLRNAQFFFELTLDGLRQRNQKRFEKVQGKRMPDFVLRNMDGKPVLLSSFKRGNQYIVLNFWGSWFPPDERDVRRMRRYYNKYSRKVQFVNIACREEDDNEWRNTIYALEMSGIHLKNVDTPKKCVAILYGVEVFPTRFILDRNLRVVARFEGYVSDFYEKLDKLLSN